LRVACERRISQLDRPFAHLASKFGHLPRSCDLFRHPAGQILLVYQDFESERLLFGHRRRLLGCRLLFLADLTRLDGGSFVAPRYNLSVEGLLILVLVVVALVFGSKYLKNFNKP
jgi:hypothetical protein